MSFTQTDSKAPYDYLQRHYRQPKTDDPVERWLPHPEVARAICGALLASGIGGKNVQDAMQDVFVKALAAFRTGTPVPADLRAMKAYCAAIAKNHAIDGRRKADKRKQDLLAAVDPEEYAPLEYGAERRDPADARRQLAVLADLFREGRMPQDGATILEGVATRATYKEIAEGLDISEELARWRMREMTRIYRHRMAKLGILPGTSPLRAVVNLPSALPVLRAAA